MPPAVLIPLQNSAWGFNIRRPWRPYVDLIFLLCVCALSGCGVTPHANPNIAFIGDSITNYWSLPATNLGVPGDTTTMMLARFPSEVLGHDYKVVVILGGTNDIRNIYASLDKEVATAIANIGNMAAQAQKAKLIVVLCSVPPVESADEAGRPEALNAQIAKLAKAQGYLYVDYYTPMAGHPEYFKDELHPNGEGYAVMKAALEKVVSLTF